MDRTINSYIYYNEYKNKLKNMCQTTKIHFNYNKQNF